ncbi:hypothetical protein E6C76_20320 [Pseudothauera nasutitermitis]|uniref:Uncharacterized protein n=1 Tax=Pseudothauera nasutitermitis TaxID=2565930 RepID=A0A4S4AP37_9RHOO|nr:hypothetical protein [Pseudothauera nasutitermitis]THF61429.1 hypothetical protein E6C76_20320 [Pseudothauera nasutitermitis]
MDARTAITQAGLAGLPPGTPITLVSSAEGYAVAAGPADRVRWLHTTNGQFRLFPTADRALALLNACGIRRIAIDLSGGTPT